jgi:hypothetical protein
MEIVDFLRTPGKTGFVMSDVILALLRSLLGGKNVVQREAYRSIDAEH